MGRRDQKTSVFGKIRIRNEEKSKMLHSKHGGNREQSGGPMVVKKVDERKWTKEVNQ
jgi:hypothetical protein